VYNEHDKRGGGNFVAKSEMAQGAKKYKQVILAKVTRLRVTLLMWERPLSVIKARGTRSRGRLI